jgi:hypothetical protein
MRKLIVLLFVILFSLSFISAETFGYNYLEEGENLNPSINYSQVNVNSSDYWDTTIGSLNNVDSDSFQNNGGTLEIILSWFSDTFDTYFGGKTTDDLTQGSVNLYDNKSWNESRGNELITTANTSMKGYVDSVAPATLTNDSMADALHRHSELSASDGTPNPALSVDASGNVGIGTTSPSLGKLQVNGSVSGISIYAQNNISAEDYLYHSPFTTSSKEESLNDILKIRGNEGKINHSTLPNDAVSILEKPIYETEDYEVTEEVCNYESKFLSDEYEYICINKVKTLTRNKQTCSVELKESFKQIENSTEYKKVIEEIEVCIDNPPISYEEEPQTSMGILLSKIVLSIQRLFDKDIELENEITILKTENSLIKLELCKKDNSYSWCK